MLAVIGVLLWLVITAGKAVLILLAAVVSIVLSVTDLVPPQPCGTTCPRRFSAAN